MEIKTTTTDRYQEADTNEYTAIYSVFLYTFSMYLLKNIHIFIIICYITMTNYFIIMLYVDFENPKAGQYWMNHHTPLDPIPRD